MSDDAQIGSADILENRLQLLPVISFRAIVKPVPPYFGETNRPHASADRFKFVAMISLGPPPPFFKRPCTSCRTSATSALQSIWWAFEVRVLQPRFARIGDQAEYQSTID